MNISNLNLNNNNKSDLIQIKYKNTIYDIYNRKNGNRRLINTNYKNREYHIQIIVDKQNGETIAILHSILKEKRKKKNSIQNASYQSRSMIDYIKSMIYYLKTNYNVKKMVLTDNSMVRCLTGLKMNLGDLYYIKYGKTWYEKHFNAQPYSNFDKEEYLRKKHDYERKLNTKINLNYQKFIDKYYCDIDLTENIEFNDFIREIIKEVYNSDLTYRDLFLLLQNEDCIFYKPLIYSIFGNGFYGMSWIIDLDEFNNQNFSKIETL
jgi:hypothetical protein